jgi:large subunit ribosomal protein L17
MRNLITSLLRDERIRTTDPKAKEVRRWVDRVVTLGKQGSLHARRQALSIVCDKAMVRKLFDTIAPRFKDRPGGYTRIIKIGRRRGDSAPISLIEFVASPESGATETPSGRKKRGSKARRSPKTTGATGQAAEAATA